MPGVTQKGIETAQVVYAVPCFTYLMLPGSVFTRFGIRSILKTQCKA